MSNNTNDGNVKVVMSKGAMKDSFGANFTVSKDNYTKKLQNATDEELYEMIMTSHDDVFVDKDGKSIKRKMLERSANAIIGNPNIPDEVKNKFTGLTPEAKSKAIIAYMNATAKLRQMTMVMASVAAQIAAKMGNDRGAAEGYMKQMTPIINSIYNEINASLGSGDVMSPTVVTDTMNAKIQAELASVDPNSDKFFIYTDVYLLMDPNTNKWVNC